jgi:pyrroloquinoline quinone (PQQ) biosynthesis protein C
MYGPLVTGAPSSDSPAHAREALPSLCATLGLGGRAQEALALFEAMTERRSDVAGAPSLSFALGPRDAEVRFIVETWTDALSPSASWSVGRALTRHLADRYGLALDPLERVEALFEPTAGGRMAMGHAAVLAGNVPPRFEVHFDAQAQGRWKAAAVVEEALVRLGFGRAWPSMAEQALRRGPYLDELQYFSIDLVGAHGDGRASIELYVRHHDATVEDVRAALGRSPLAARAEELCLAMTGSPGPYRARPLVTCHAFEEPGAPEPSSCAIRVPVAAYGPTDAVTRGRVSAYLALLGLSSDAYERALAGYARRPLAARAGLQSHVGMREDRGGHTVSIDLSPEVHTVAHVTSHPSDPQPHGLPPPDEIVRRFENDIVLADHPFLRRIAREPVQLGPLWLMIANFWEGIVQHFPRRLSQVIARIDDDRIRCVLAKQLNDELGEGDFEQAHKAMFQKFVEAVEPYRIEGSDDVLLAPGRAFGQELGAMLFSEDPYETVGAMMMIEVYGKQTDIFMGSQFRRQDRIDSGALRWLHLHEGLEVDHANDSLTLAHCVPADPAAIASAWRGAEAIVTAGRHYFDAFYRICFA